MFMKPSPTSTNLPASEAASGISIRPKCRRSTRAPAVAKQSPSWSAYGRTNRSIPNEMDRSTIPAVLDCLLTSGEQAVTTTSPALQHPAENLLKETRVMNSITERKSAGVKFLEEHEELQGRHDTALLTLSTQAKMLDKQDAEIRLLEDRVKNAEA